MVYVSGSNVPLPPRGHSQDLSLKQNTRAINKTLGEVQKSLGIEDPIMFQPKSVMKFWSSQTNPRILLDVIKDILGKVVDVSKQKPDDDDEHLDNLDEFFDRLSRLVDTYSRKGSCNVQRDSVFRNMSDVIDQARNSIFKVPEASEGSDESFLSSDITSSRWQVESSKPSNCVVFEEDTVSYSHLNAVSNGFPEGKFEEEVHFKVIPISYSQRVYSGARSKIYVLNPQYVTQDGAGYHFFLLEDPSQKSPKLDQLYANRVKFCDDKVVIYETEESKLYKIEVQRGIEDPWPVAD